MDVCHHYFLQDEFFYRCLFNCKTFVFQYYISAALPRHMGQSSLSRFGVSEKKMQITSRARCTRVVCICEKQLLTVQTSARARVCVCGVLTLGSSSTANSSLRYRPGQKSSIPVYAEHQWPVSGPIPTPPRGQSSLLWCGQAAQHLRDVWVWPVDFWLPWNVTADGGDCDETDVPLLVPASRIHAAAAAQQSTTLCHC